jgi:hypothetical protein
MSRIASILNPAKSRVLLQLRLTQASDPVRTQTMV